MSSLLSSVSFAAADGFLPLLLVWSLLVSVVVAAFLPALRIPGPAAAINLPVECGMHDVSRAPIPAGTWGVSEEERYLELMQTCC